MTPGLSKRQKLIREDTVFPERITARQCALNTAKSLKTTQTQGRICCRSSQSSPPRLTICSRGCRQSPQ